MNGDNNNNENSIVTPQQLNVNVIFIVIFKEIYQNSLLGGVDNDDGSSLLFKTL